MEDEVLKKFGRYFLLDRIAQGGMAEIYRARMTTSDGGVRLLAIKRITSGMGSNSEFVEMFQSEIKVAMGFSHPNIVQLFDFGEEKNQPYIAMDLVDGKNLRQLITKQAERKMSFPVELAAYIVEQAAAGLHYAHEFKDKITGQHLGIIHRDVSPQNLLISFEGNVKVIDFGIAKADTGGENTRVGVIKGKPSYLSPEQISGEKLDRRCDVFALGIVLWETLTGRKLFAAKQGDNEFAVLKLIESCETYVKPPSQFNPNVPKELDYIVLRALAKNRDKRFQTANEMQRALHKFIYSFAPDFNPEDLSHYIRDFFKDDIVADRKKLQLLNEKVERLIKDPVEDESQIKKGLDIEVPTQGEGFRPGAAPHRSPPPEKDTTTIVDRKGVLHGTSGALERFTPEEATADQVEIDPQSSPHLKGLPQSKSSSKFGSQITPQSRIPKQKLPEPKGKAKEKGGRSWVALLGLVALVLVFGPDYGLEIPYVTQMLGLQKEKKSPSQTTPPQNTRPRKTAAQGSQTQASPPDTSPKKGMILLRLKVLPGGGNALVKVNGQQINLDHPVIRVPLDEPLELVAERDGFRNFYRDFVITSSQTEGAKEWLMEVPLEPEKFGYLTIHTTPSAEATIQDVENGGGRPWVMKTPIDNRKFPVGTYSIRLENAVLGMEKTLTIRIEEGKSINRSVRLEIN